MKYIYKLLVVLLCLPLCGLMCSCSESEEDTEEFADWKNVNDTYFENLYEEALSGSDSSLKVIRCWSMPTDENSAGYEQKATDCIVVKVLEEGAGTESPIYKDTVSCHYEGRLLPSTSYPEGYVFDKSYTGNFNVNTASPASFSTDALVDGFTTALEYMHAGDRWRVYIPYKLGYDDDTSNSEIPAYSTLIFDIRLVKFWHPVTPTD